ncbi:unnamed protein product [Toxocara canis]|uniref:DC_STAMP domain-containing protein n=1 Tax=Toxocara canis TaxID=6265 RepID=A0A183UV88_TOXCA|nr:unnamed protein product [Toxocara canis]
MSVDAEIEEVRQTINEIHRALYKIDAHLNGAVENVQRELTYFDQRLQSIAAEASRISTQVIQTVSTFPNQQIYLAIIMILDVLIWLVVGMLIYKAILAWRHRYVISERFMQKALGYPKKAFTKQRTESIDDFVKNIRAQAYAIVP